MRETRDLLRRRTYLVRKRAELLTHVQIRNAQYNLAPFPKKLSFAAASGCRTGRTSYAGSVMKPCRPCRGARDFAPRLPWRRAAWSKGTGQGVPIVTMKRSEKTSTKRLRTLISEAI